MAASKVSVRMYNVGFGDAFLVTVDRDDGPWRMLVDCGVHSQGQVRKVSESVDAVISDLAGAAASGTPHLDVVVATHHHADHISGFSMSAWEGVEVDEVWVPFVEDQSDPDAAALRLAQTETARRLLGLIDARTHGLDPGAWPIALREAQWFALNSFGNADSTDRLLGRNGRHFAGDHRVRYLPGREAGENTVELAGGDVVVHVLGPSRDPDELKRMNPPKSAGWLRLDLDDLADADDLADVPLFDPEYVVGDDSTLSEGLLEARRSLSLATVTNDVGLRGAASILERSVNNTSLFLVLEVAGMRFVFPGDSQEGAWQHVLKDDRKRQLLSDAVFYKIGHHGSHNATPKRFVQEVWRAEGFAMLPWGLVKRWRDSIPEQKLMEALHEHGHTVVRADAAQPIDGRVTVHGDLWSEISFPVPV